MEFIRVEGVGRSAVTVYQMSEEERLAYIAQRPIIPYTAWVDEHDLQARAKERQGISNLQFSKQRYRRLRKNGWTDPKICSFHEFGIVALQNWKECTFTDEELEELEGETV